MEENKQMEKEVVKIFLLEVYLKEQCQKISHNSNSGNYHKIE